MKHEEEKSEIRSLNRRIFGFRRVGDSPPDFRELDLDTLELATGAMSCQINDPVLCPSDCRPCDVNTCCSFGVDPV